MTADEIRQKQAPFKEKFKQDPASALVTISASGVVDIANVACKFNDWPPHHEAGLHPLAGGDTSRWCAAEMLLFSLIGCAGVTLAAVATALQMPIESCELHADGELDFRGTLGISRDVPVGFQKIALTVNIKSSATDEQLNKLVDLMHRYCVVYQTLAKQAELSTSLKRHA